MVAYWAFHIMIQKLFVSNKHIIIRIIKFLHIIFLFNIILFCGKKSVKFLWFCVPHAIFVGQTSDAIYLVFLTLGVRVVLFSSEGYDV